MWYPKYLVTSILIHIIRTPSTVPLIFGNSHVGSDQKSPDLKRNGDPNMKPS